MTQEYKILFNALTDAIALLQAAQIKAEQLYIERSDKSVINLSEITRSPR